MYTLPANYPQTDTMPLSLDYPMPHLSEGPGCVATNIFFSLGPLTAHSEPTSGKAWRSSPCVELVHTAAKCNQGLEVGSLVPLCISFGFVPQHLGVKGNSFSRLIDGRPSRHADTWDVPLVEATHLEKLGGAVRSLKLEDDIRPLLQGVADNAKWCASQSARLVESMKASNISLQPCSSGIQLTDNTRTIFATTGKMIQLISRPIGDEGQTIHTFISPGAICETSEATASGEAETTMRPGVESCTWVYQCPSGKEAGIARWETRATQNVMDDFASRFGVHIAKQQMDSIDLGKSGWTLRDFRHHLREYESDIISATTRACDEMPGWYGKVSEVSALDLTSLNV